MRYRNLDLHSESDVEQKFILPLLKNPVPLGLGYDACDFRTKADIRKLVIDKGRSRKRYFPDYAIIISGLPIAIVEAKSPKESLDEALREARLYATELNSLYPQKINPCTRIIATNGIDLVCGLWDQAEPIVNMKVHDITETSISYADLLDLIEKRKAVTLAKEILRLVRKTADYVKPVRLLGGKSVANESVGENSFGANISVEYKYLFNPDESKDRNAIATNAYVPSKRRQSHVSPIDKIIRASTPLSIVDSLPLSDTIAPTELFTSLRDQERLRNELCLLVGSVGSGKTTFMDHLRLVALPEDLRDSTEWIHVNLNNAPMSREMIYEWFLASATRDIESQHPNIDFNSLASLRAIYARPISEFEKGPLSLFHKESEQYAERLYEEIMRLRADKEISFECLLDHLYCGRNKLPIIVLDNCDKRLKDDQLLCFQVASWIKARFSCTVFLPIRDTTYDQYHSEPPLDTVIKDLVFRIDPPLLDRVVQKRLDYAVRQIDSDNRSFRYSLPDGKFVECRRQEVSVYLKSMVASIFQEATFKRIVAGLAGRNIRRGLEIFLDFCKSGHLGEAEIFKIRASNGGYTLPPHIVIKILMKGKRRYYSDSSAFIRNLFDSRSDDELPNPLLRADLLQWLKTHNRLKGPNRAKGFHKASIVLAAMQARGHAPMRVLEELGTLARTGCIRSEMIGEDISEEDLISIAPGGYVHLDLTRNVSFLSVVAEDTFFRVSDVAKRISENMVGSGRFRRDTAAASFDSAIALVQYLHDYENKFLPGTAKLLDEVASEGFFDLAELNSWLIRKAENQKSLAEVESNEREFPPGTIVEAQLTSIREFGMFVEFGAKGVGFVSRKSTGAQWHRWCNELEDGDFVSVEIVRYNHQHHKFDVALVDEG